MCNYQIPFRHDKLRSSGVAVFNEYRQLFAQMKSHSAPCLGHEKEARGGAERLKRRRTREENKKNTSNDIISEHILCYKLPLKPISEHMVSGFGTTPRWIVTHNCSLKTCQSKHFAGLPKTKMRI